MKARCCSTARSISAWSTLSKLSLRRRQASRCLYTSHTSFLYQLRIHVVSSPPPLSCYSLALSRHPLPSLARSTPFSPLTRLYNHGLASPLRSRAFLGPADIHGEFNLRACLRGISSRFDQQAPLLNAVESFAVPRKQERRVSFPQLKNETGGGGIKSRKAEM